MSKRFINYIIARVFKNKRSWQSALFDTTTCTSVYASDFMFTPDELKHW